MKIVKETDLVKFSTNQNFRFALNLTNGNSSKQVAEQITVNHCEFIVGFG